MFGFILFFLLCLPINTIANADLDTIIQGSPVQKNETAVSGATILLISADAKNPKDFANCTAILIAPEILLTAAHCLRENPKLDQFYAIAGEEIKTVVSYTSHPQYQVTKDPVIGEVTQHDIAIVFLSQQFSGPHIPALLPSKGYSVPRGTSAIIAGFGKTSNKVDKPGKISELQWAQVSLQETSENIIVEGPKTTCSGDSGGPAYVVQGKRLMVVGVVSTGDCDRLAKFTKVANHLDWLQAEINRFQAR